MELQKALKTEQYDLSVYATYNDDEPNECEYNTNVVVFTWARAKENAKKRKEDKNGI